jgi:hypothetical protein
MEDPDLSAFENFLTSHLHNGQIELGEERRLEIRARHHAARSDADAELAPFAEWLGGQLQPREESFDEITTRRIRAAMEEVQDLERFTTHLHQILPPVPRPRASEQDRIRRRVGTLPPRKHALTRLAAALTLLLGISYLLLAGHPQRDTGQITKMITPSVPPRTSGPITEAGKESTQGLAQTTHEQSTHHEEKPWQRSTAEAKLDAGLDFAQEVPTFLIQPVFIRPGGMEDHTPSMLTTSNTLRDLLTQDYHQNAYPDAPLHGLQSVSPLIPHGDAWAATSATNASLIRPGEIRADGRLLMAMADSGNNRDGHSLSAGAIAPMGGSSSIPPLLDSLLMDGLGTGSSIRQRKLDSMQLPYLDEVSGSGMVFNSGNITASSALASVSRSAYYLETSGFVLATSASPAQVGTSMLSSSLTSVITAGAIGDAITQGDFQDIQITDPDDTNSGLATSTTNNFTLATAQPYLFRSLFYEGTADSTLVASNQVGADLFFMSGSSDYADDLSSTSTNRFSGRISIETPLLRNVTAGIGFDQSWSDAHIDQYGSVDLHSDLFRIFLKNQYGNFHQQLSYSFAQIRQHLVPDAATGDQDDQDAAMSDLHYFSTLELGDDHFSYGPFLDLSYLQGSTDSLKEASGTRMASRDFSLGDLIMGMRFSQSPRESGFGKWRVHEQLAWQHSFLQPDSTIREKNGNTTLEYTPATPAENSIIGGMGLEWSPWSNNLSLQADYTLGLRNANEADQSLLLRLHYSF